MPTNATRTAEEMNDTSCLEEFINMFLDLHGNDLVEILEMSELLRKDADK